MSTERQSQVDTAILSPTEYPKECIQTSQRQQACNTRAEKISKSFHFFLSTQGFWGLTTYFRSRQWHDSFQTPCHHSAKTQLSLVWVPFDTTLTIKYPIELKAVFLLSSPTWRKGRKIISNSKLRFICNGFQVAHTCICFLNNLLCTVQYCFFSCLSRTEKYSTPTEIHCS